MAQLFKNKTLKAELKDYVVPDFEQRLAIIKSWHEASKNGSLKKKTETQCEQAFNQDFFVNILGYTAFPKDPYTIDPKASTETSGQKPDAVLGYFSGEFVRVAAVVEIKDANTPLDRSQRREGNFTPVQQAFKYKPQYKECGFVIATNFIEFRLHRDNQLDFERFTLEELASDKDDYFSFKKFYYLLNVQNFVMREGKTHTEKILAEIRIEEERISKDFYKEYKLLRQQLIKNIVKNKGSVKTADFPTIVEKAQKIIDRIVFICFCEDLGLLPENKINEVVRYAGNSPLPPPIWSTMKDFFAAIDHGSIKLDIPNGYNGELFKEDSVLNALKIDDEICRKFTEFGKFDFAEDLSVNILGHIFEQSISDIEEIKSIGNIDDAQKKPSKRKKDGIFYTPDYIVDYIVKNTLGAYLESVEHDILSNRKLKLKENIQEENYNKRAIEAYTEYQERLQTVRILDLACGSGAFLVKVFDYLLSEYKRVGAMIAEMSGVETHLYAEEGVIKDVLQNNIYGVDLNPESVEITKLSLWLKTAKKGEKLVTLKDNIKCGNSLVDDESVAGDSAFNWQKEFEGVMSKGGFDVVVGNPPYFNVETLGANSPYTKYLQEAHPEVWMDKSDILFYFFAKAIQLTKEKGKIGFIVSNAFLFSDKARKLRNYVLDKSQVTKIVNFEQYMVFEDASITSAIVHLSKAKTSYKSKALVFKEKQMERDDVIRQVNDPQNYFDVTFKKDSVWALANSSYEALDNKIDSAGEPIGDLFEVGSGMQTGLNDVFIFSQYPSQFPKAFIKKRMSGEIMERYLIKEPLEYCLYVEDVEEFDSLPEAIRTFLANHKEELSERADKKRRATAKWWNYTFAMHREHNNLNKIWCSYRAKDNTFVFDDTNEYLGLTNTTVIFGTNPKLNLKYVLALLNSKLLNFRYKRIGKQTGSGVYEYF